MEAYVVAVEKEMEFRRDFLAGEPVKTIFFGGGTPSLYAPAIIQRLIDKAASLWDLSEVGEITVEVNPDDATDEYLEALAATDVNRISFGVQSFIDRDLVLLGRRHNSEQAVNAVRKAREKGFGDISVDLIFGIPGQSMKDLDRNLMKAIALQVDHISTYHLTIEEGTPFGKMAAAGQLKPVDDLDSEAQFQLIHSVLARSGFDHYEVSNYARGPQFRAIHNYSYWTGDKYLGLGPSAHSYDGDQRSFSVGSLEEYMKGVGTDAIYGREILTREDKFNEYIMVSLRTAEGIKRDALAEKFGVEKVIYFEYAADKFLNSGMLVKENNTYRIPPEKFLMSDSVIRELFHEGEDE